MYRPLCFVNRVQLTVSPTIAFHFFDQFFFALQQVHQPLDIIPYLELFT